MRHACPSEESMNWNTGNSLRSGQKDSCQWVRVLSFWTQFPMCVCGGWGFPTHQINTPDISHQLGVLKFNSVLTLSTRRSLCQILQVKGLGLQDCPSIHTSEDNHKPGLSPVLLTNSLEIGASNNPFPGVQTPVQSPGCYLCFWQRAIKHRFLQPSSGVWWSWYSGSENAWKHFSH